MIEIYFGDGKGKTTAAVGLAVRACGYGLPVTVAQFLKTDRSGERAVLRNLPGVTGALAEYDGFCSLCTWYLKIKNSE